MVLFTKAAVVASALFANVALAIWPIPATYKHGSTVVWIDDSAKWVYQPPSGLVSGSTSYRY